METRPGSKREKLDIVKQLLYTPQHAEKINKVFTKALNKLDALLETSNPHTRLQAVKVAADLFADAQKIILTSAMVNQGSELSAATREKLEKIVVEYARTQKAIIPIDAELVETKP